MNVAQLLNNNCHFRHLFLKHFDYLIYIFRMLTEMPNLKMVSNLRNFVFYVCSNFFFLVRSFFFFCLCQTYFLCFSLPNFTLAYVSVFKLFLFFCLDSLFSLVSVYVLFVCNFFFRFIFFLPVQHAWWCYVGIHLDWDLFFPLFPFLLIRTLIFADLLTHA